jgi:hypothetical protein
LKSYERRRSLIATVIDLAWMLALFTIIAAAVTVYANLGRGENGDEYDRS